jgi:hypothetical protein
MTTTDPTIAIVPTPEWTAALTARFWIAHTPDRIRQAIALREQGHTYEEIALRLGYGNRQAAFWAVNRSAAAREVRGKCARRAVLALEAENRIPGHCNASTDDAGERRAA